MKHAEPAKPGTKLAGFNVLAEVGRGAASIIYLVQDAKNKQIWALKHVEKHDAKDQRFLDQAEAEAQVSSKLDHPALRKVHRVIKGRKLLTVTELFLLMEYVDGVAIDRNPPKSLFDAVDIFRKVARGLAHMHQMGWVHADMKPNNVVVLEDGSVKVIDLGQSCRVGTIKERIQGTPDYIAPEQVHRREITGKTDIYNLGATMYWVLSGKHIPTAIPKGDSLVGSLDDQFIEKADPVRELNPNVPEKLADLVMRSIEVDPMKRPESMAWVADQLDLVHTQLEAEQKGASKDMPESREPEKTSEDSDALDRMFRRGAGGGGG